MGKPLAPLLLLVISRAGFFLPVEQQPHPGPCAALYSATVFGAWALRSLVALPDKVTELTYRLDVQHEVTAMVADGAIARAGADANGDVPW